MRCETVVIGLNWVGDNVLALPTYKALQARFRSSGGIAVAAPANVSTLFETTGLFKQVIGWSGSTSQRRASLRGGGFRRAIILPNSFRAAAITFGAGIQERWGYPTDWRRLLLTHPIERKQPREHQVNDYSDLLTALGAEPVVSDVPSIKLPPSVRERGRRRLQAIGLHLDRPIFGVHAGGLFGRAKHWGDEAYVDVIRRLRKDGFDIVLLTSPGERAQAEQIAMTCNGVPIIGHEGDVLELSAAISQCAAIVTNDSGPLHIATALGVPSVSIFGPTDPQRTVIAGATRVVQSSLGCQPCYQRVCPLGTHACMNDITSDQVFAAATELFERQSAVPGHSTHVEA
jgi:heptosyltransferase II